MTEANSALWKDLNFSWSKYLFLDSFFMKKCWAMENNFGGAKLLSLGDEIIILKDCFFLP